MKQNIYIIFTFIYKHIYYYTLLYIYAGGVGVLGGVWWWCPRCGVVVVSSVWCGGVLGGVSVSSVWCVVSFLVCGGGVSVSSVAYIQPSTQAGTHEAPQCGGGLASESKFQGRIDECDRSNYQLFRCPF